MRGEDWRSARPKSASLGSPPHARGRRRTWRQPSVRRRITPACAGKTLTRSSGRSSASDHPRMRGEDRAGYLRLQRRVGSPPHARGRRRAQQNICQRSRITPACAGKTCVGGDRMSAGTDHPRMRGEDCAFSNTTGLADGSPPHARGRLYGFVGRVADVQDHPRMRGEDLDSPSHGIVDRGSPPHARGRRSSICDQRR